MIITERHIALTIVLVASTFFLWGCGKKSDQSTPPASPDSQSKATQMGVTGAIPDGSASPEAIVAATAPPDAGKTAGGSQQASWQVVIPTGTPITVRLQERLSSASAVPGERFDAVIDEPIVVRNQVVVPVGALAVGHVVLARRSGRLRHPGELGVTLDSITVGQDNVHLATSSVVVRGGSYKKRNWAFIGGGTGGGALIGALAAGGKGALIGSGIGAAAGTTTAFITGKKNVAFGVERRLRFRVDRNVSVSG